MTIRDRRVVRRVLRGEDENVDTTGWPFTMAPVTQLLENGLALEPGVTFLVGENGSGKSTVIEAIAMASGLSPEGGSIYANHTSRESESPLHKAIRLERAAGSPRRRAHRASTATRSSASSTSSPATARK